MAHCITLCLALWETLLSSKASVPFCVQSACFESSLTFFFSFVDHAFGVVSKKSLPYPGSPTFFFFHVLEVLHSCVACIGL